MAERWIAYLVAPEFCITLARHAEPSLASRPLILLDERGQVLAADTLAGRAGVVSGQTERQAMARCPVATLRPAARYPIFEIQAELLARVAGYTNCWQPAGLGSVYMDTMGFAGDFVGWCQALGVEVRRLGMMPGVGLTNTKFGALVAGQAAGQNTMLMLGPGSIRAFLADQPVALLPLPPDVLLHLKHLGIRTLGQFARLPAAGVLTRFGAAGRIAQRWAQGQDDRPVTPLDQLPEVSARIEFDGSLTSRDILLAALMRRAELLLQPLRDRLQAVGRLELAVTRGDGRVLPLGHTFPLPTAAANTVQLALESMLERAIWDGEGTTDVTLTFADITDAPGQQLTLLDTPASRTALAATLNKLAARYGSDIFHMATLVDPANPLPERRTSWQRFYWR